MVVKMGQTSKQSDTLIYHYVVTNNVPVTKPIGDSYNSNLALNEVVIGFSSGKVCAKALVSRKPIVVHTVEFGNNYTSPDHKNL